MNFLTASHGFESRPTPTRLAKALITIRSTLSLFFRVRGVWNLLVRLRQRIARTLTEEESDAELRKFQGRDYPSEVGVAVSVGVAAPPGLRSLLPWVSAMDSAYTGSLGN
jgi:hypothetical protein